MTEKKTPDNEPISVSLARKPVFDAKRRLWGYELFCVSSTGDTSSGLPEEHCVAFNLASSTYIGLQQILDRGKKIIVNFNEKSILDDLPYALPPVLAAVKVTDPFHLKDSVLENLNKLKSEGYMIAVEWLEEGPDSNGLLALADLICLSVLNRSKEKLEFELLKTRRHNALLLADQVEDMALFEACSGLGFELFCGPFFKAPEKISVRKITPGEVSRFQIFEVIEKDDPDMDKLAEIIQADVTISFRLLSYLNSAAFGFAQKIRSIRQAISLLGWRKIRNWLRVVVLTDMARAKTASELIFLSTQRGRFLETVAIEHDYWGFDPDTLQLLGMFSLLDAILVTSMEEIVRYLPLEERLKAALRREPNNEYLPLIHLAECLEEAKWGEGEQMIQQLSLDRSKVKAAFQSAIDWANEFMSVQLNETAQKD